MTKRKYNTPVDEEQLLRGLQSPDAAVRARATRSLCPCHAGWEIFEQRFDLVELLKKDASPEVRANALHVFEDATEMQSEGYPTHPREVTDEMLRTRRASRFPLDQEALQAVRQEKAAARRHRRSRS